ncbi:hypothetical protein HY995_00410 [Candidatus Micrarchaeota archaeon]|nr:hypothetical protein [Candidatus Micrarchaeota archaeon]
MTKTSIICPGGDNSTAIFAGIKEMPTGTVFILATESSAKEAYSSKSELAKFKIEAKIISIKGDLWESVFREVGELAANHSSNIMVNVGATRDSTLQCIVTCAAFVNGIRAFGVSPKGELMLLPVLKFSYYRFLTDRKMQLLRVLDNPECCASLNELSEKTGMSLPLVSYHVNGNRNSEGLIGLGLAETSGKRKNISVQLSPLGKMLVRGYVKIPKEKKNSN